MPFQPMSPWVPVWSQESPSFHVLREEINRYDSWTTSRLLSTWWRKQESWPEELLCHLGSGSQFMVLHTRLTERIFSKIGGITVSHSVVASAKDDYQLLLSLPLVIHRISIIINFRILYILGHLNFWFFITKCCHNFPSDDTSYLVQKAPAQQGL